MGSNNNDMREVRLGDEDERKIEMDRPPLSPTPGKAAAQDLAAPQSLEKQKSQILGAVSFYFFISISLVFLNKAIMKNYKFELPLFITWYQQVVSLVCIYLLGIFGRSYSVISFIPPFEFRTIVAKDIMPLTTVLIGMISFNNLCLQYVEVSFYQVARSLSICFSILLTYLILGQKTSQKAILACGLVFLGFVLGSLGEVNFSWLGVIFGIASSMFVALYSIYVKKVLPYVEGNEWKLMAYNTTLSIPMLFPLVLLNGEIGRLQEEPVASDPNFWVVMTITGVFGYLISVAIFMQIKHTSPLTNTISGTVKACVQTILAVVIWGNEITGTNAMGIGLVIAGSFWYSMIRYSEMRK
eukprot:TRINITY_DN2557_c0_g1_i3.p1 TRINITY_DN2557_c0_g1~~TRINITY_DN2557_c0_g1_i3.p1  ORF type:complete len:363 (-),score=77.93 TRINITY_DN2557_c0_g1_i3:19-1083(-)